IHHFNLKPNLFGFAVIKCDEKTAHVEQSANLRIDPLEEDVRLQRGAKGPANFIEDVELFSASGRLLNQVAVLDGHADLVTEREQEPQLGCGEIAVVGSSEQQNSEHAFLGLQADFYHRAEALVEQHFPEMLELFFFFERRPARIGGKVAKHGQPAQASHKVDHVLVEIILLCCGAKRIAHARDNDRGGPLRIAIMQAQRTGRNADDVENTIERLRQHLLNLAAHEARRGEVQVRKRQHVAFNTAPLLFVNGHHHQHAGEELRQRYEWEQIDIREASPESRLENRSDPKQAPANERNREQKISP